MTPYDICLLPFSEEGHRLRIYDKESGRYFPLVPHARRMVREHGDYANYLTLTFVLGELSLLAAYLQFGYPAWPLAASAFAYAVTAYWLSIRRGGWEGLLSAAIAVEEGMSLPEAPPGCGGTT